MKLYRIHTENKNYGAINSELNRMFPDGYVVISTGERWAGKQVKSLIIEIMGSYAANTPENIEHFAYWLRKHNQQDAVLVQVLDITDWLL